MAKYSYPILTVLSDENERDSFDEYTKCLELLETFLTKNKIPYTVKGRYGNAATRSCVVDVNDFYKIKDILHD